MVGRSVLGRMICQNSVLFTVVGILEPGYSSMTTGQRLDEFVPVATKGSFAEPDNGRLTKFQQKTGRILTPSRNLPVE